METLISPPRPTPWIILSTLSSPSPSSLTWGPRRPGERAWPTTPSLNCTPRSSSKSLPRTSWSSPRPAWTRLGGDTASLSPCCRYLGPRLGPRPPRRSPWSPSRGRAAITANTGGTAAGTWSPSTWASILFLISSHILTTGVSARE